MSTKNPTLVHFRHFSHFSHSFNYTVFPIHLFMQNKPNFRDTKMNINTCLTMNYVILSHWLRRKNKPNSKPIKPKTNPIKANTNPIQTQSKPILCQFIQSLSPRSANLDILQGKSHNLGLQQGTYLPAFKGVVERQE